MGAMYYFTKKLIRIFYLSLFSVYSGSGLGCSDMQVELYDYHPSISETPFGTLTIELKGTYKEDLKSSPKKTIRGNPYYLLIRQTFKDKEPKISHIKLKSAELKSESEELIDFQFKNTAEEVKGPGYDDFYYVSFLYENINIKYEKYIIKGKLIYYMDDDQVGEIEFSHVLEKNYHFDKVNAWLESLKGI